MIISELVNLDIHGEFRSDVQLSDYDSPGLNRELLRNYIFTVHAPATYGAQQRSLSAVGVLDQLKTIFTVERAENRIVLTANYGHGKSHLALVLANFFGRPVESPEVQIIFDRLSQALNDRPRVAGYQDFKQSKGEFLVIRLQGDAFSDLQEGFVRALEQALREHEATRAVEMPFWYRNAQQWINSLAGRERQKAEEFLARHNTDLVTLSESLSRQGSYELVRELAKHVAGVYPDFGRDVSLDEILVWAIDEVCVPNGFGGLLVLFDEFGLFLQRYMAARTVGKLQELLNGISKRPGKCAFLAFSQQDVDTIAETYASGQRREDVKKELERLPKDKRARLYSLMESVLAAYLKQDMTSWSTCFEQPAKKGHLVQAHNITLDYFSKRYKDELNWDSGAFDEKVVRGCFPLHPLTTAILSTHNFEAGAAENPRTALQFVRRVWEDVHQEPVFLPGDRPNFVYPVALVSFFGEQISKKWFAAYRNAVAASPQSLSDEQKKVLQALLIQQAVEELKELGSKQIELLHHLSGVEQDNIRPILKDLADHRVIRFDTKYNFYSLWPETVRPQEIEGVIRQAVEATPIDQSLMEKIIGCLSPIELSSLNFGHVSDWAPIQVALTGEMFTEEKLQKLLRPYHLGANTIEEGPRGVVIWLIAQTEEEKIRLRQSAQEMLDKALEKIESPLPAVIVLPKRAAFDVIDSARRLEAIANLSTSAREKIGIYLYDHEKKLAEDHFKSALHEFFGDLVRYMDISRDIGEYALPRAYRAAVQVLRNYSLKAVVTECYRLAYRCRPEFYTQHQVSGKGPNKLRQATQKIARWLFTDSVGIGIRNSRNKDIEYQLSTQYLTQKWGLLDPEKYFIQPPSYSRLQKAWELLEQAFPPGCNEARILETIFQLMNPPYGHDSNTLTLLLAAWMGFHRHELRLSLAGRLISLDQLVQRFDDAKNPQDFLAQVCTSLCISRLKPDDMITEVDAVLERIGLRSSFTIEDAQQALATLEQARNYPRLADTKRDQIEKQSECLRGALQRAQEYDEKARDFLSAIETSNIKNLLDLRKALASFPRVSLVLPNQPDQETLQKRWEEAFQRILPSFCEVHSQLTDLADYKSKKDRLLEIRKDLEGFPQFQERINTALTKLDQARADLEKRESEKTIIAEINSMTPSADLQTLYKYRGRLLSLKDLSEQTAKLREAKLAQITRSIQVYEAFAAQLPQAIDDAASSNVVRKLRDGLIGYLERVENTKLYETLIESKKRLEELENFFNQLREITSLPQDTPQDFADIGAKLKELAERFADRLSSSQKQLITEQMTAIEKAQLQKTQQARQWLEELERRSERGESIEKLLREVETPHPFLPPEGVSRLEQLKHRLQQRLNEDIVLQIETLFRKIQEPEVRSRCLKRLHEIMGE